MKHIKLFEEFVTENANESKVSDAIKGVAKVAGRAAVKFVAGKKILNLVDQLKSNKEKATKLAKKAQNIAKSDKPTKGLDAELNKVQQKIVDVDNQKIALKQQEVKIQQNIAKEKEVEQAKDIKLKQAAAKEKEVEQAQKAVKSKAANEGVGTEVGDSATLQPNPGESEESFKIRTFSASVEDYDNYFKNRK